MTNTTNEKVDERINAWNAVWERIIKYSPTFAWRHYTGQEAVLAWIDEHAALTAERDTLKALCVDALSVAQDVDGWLVRTDREGTAHQRLLHEFITRARSILK